MFPGQICHYEVDKMCPKSHDNLFKNYVIPEGGYVKRLCWIIRGGGGQADP